MSNIVYSVDWFQVYGYCNSLYFHNMYNIEKAEYGSRQFRDIFIVRDWASEELCTIQRNPFSSVIDSRMTIVKFSNNLLYQPNWASRCASILRDLDIEFKGISRVDICADFNDMHRGMNPQLFIKKVFACEYLHTGRALMTVKGRQVKEMQYEYFRIGSNESPCAAYLYNKTKELEDVKDKPYIRQLWQSNGLDLERPVWRLEFSIKSGTVKVLREDTGELIDIDQRFLQYDANVRHLFYMLCDRYFRFKRNDGKANKSRMDDIIVLQGRRGEGKVINYTPKIGGNRSDKVFLKKLHLIKDDLTCFPLRIQEAALELKAFFVFEKDMLSFYERKIEKLDTIK